MSDFVLVKLECDTVDVKEENVEEEDPLITANGGKGDNNPRFQVFGF